MTTISVRQTVFAAIGFLAIVALSQAAVGWFSQRQMAASIQFSNSTVQPTLEAVSDLSSAVLRARTMLLKHITVNDDSTMTTLEGQIQEQLGIIETSSDTLKSLAVDDIDVQTQQAVSKLATDWETVAQKLMDVSHHNQKDLASTLFAEQDKIADALEESIDAAAEEKKSDAALANSSAAATAAFAQWSTIALTLLLALTAAATLAVLVLRVLRPLKAITLTMGELANQNYAVQIDALKRQDEIGEMARAVAVFKQNGLEVSELNAAQALRSGQEKLRAEAMSTLMDGLAVAVRAAIDGDFKQRISGHFDDADLLAVSKDVNALLESVDGGIAETGRVLSALARTDLTLRMQGEYRGVFAKLKDDTNAVVDNLRSVVGHLRETSGALKSATGEILAGANDLAERTTKQAAAVEETSAAMEQLSGTVIDNAKRAEQANAKAQAVAATAAQTGPVMSLSNEAMERISSSSAKISNIIGLIDDIAFQTNLLALNASVEAARAGDAGKGFAVVAVEVRRLAQSAASASSEVKVLIEQSATEVAAGSRLVADASVKLQTMLGSIEESATLIRQIASASQEQSAAIGEVSIAIRQMDEMTQHNAALVEQTNAAIEQTESQAADLDQIVDRFVIDAGSSRGAAIIAKPSAPAHGIKGLQQKVKAAANSYLSRGATALKQDRSEF